LRIFLNSGNLRKITREFKTKTFMRVQNQIDEAELKKLSAERKIISL